MNIIKLSKISLACCALSAVFALSSISFNPDISLLAFPLAFVFTVVLSFFSTKRLFKIQPVENSNGKQNAWYIPIVRELLQYEPYILLVAFILRRAGDDGTSAVLDVFQVVLWLIISILTLVILHYLKQKSMKKINPSWHQFVVDRKYAENQKRKAMTPKSIVRIIAFEIVSWIDALVQAVFMVLLLNIFIVQLYEIPSESMVPEFLIRDRVAVFKIFNGPKFPLSNVGLPHMKSYDRGDIVVFRNPHYSSDRKSEVKTFVSQLVYMCSLTTKNINVDEYGRPKADPLVKRVVGVPGEQLMMQDGILYSRTAEYDQFKPVELDTSYACWNLSAVKNSIKSGIQEFILCDVNDSSMSMEEKSKIAQKVYDSMIDCEKKRNSLNIGAVKKDFMKLSNQFDLLHSSFSGNKVTSKFELSPSELSVLKIESGITTCPLFQNIQQITMGLLSSSNGAEWFYKFLLSWSMPDFGEDLYSESNFKLNLMIKNVFARLVVRNAELYTNKVPVSSWYHDEELTTALNEAEMLVNYVALLDRRNMPIFPSNDENGRPQYIPENSYFIMGDNRFNSLDMRHSYEERTVSLTAYDTISVTYSTNLAPQTVDRSKILGTTAYRFWPLSRKGVPGHTGM